MKNRGLMFSASATIVLLAAIIVIVIIGKDREKNSTDSAKEITALKNLPEDKKAASREFAKVKKSLSRLAPSKPYIVIDTHANILSLRKGNSVLFKADCSTGSGGELIDSLTGRRWIFNTPHGVFKINNKLVKPWWRKPDWAYIEDSLRLPAKESERYDSEMMGDYAVGFGDGYFIHGTIYERLIGVSVTHGCVRLGAEDLKYLYEKVPIGTLVYIF